MDTNITAKFTARALLDTVNRKFVLSMDSTNLDYKFVKPITCTDSTITITNYISVPAKKNIRVQAGFMFGAGPLGAGLGPELGLLTKQDNSYTYRYDLISKSH